jgi:iron only hydrogenase large subunit-like protein
VASKNGENPEEKSLKITLNDCLACSGCVTSAETVLLEQQSTEEFLRVLDSKEASSSEKEKVIVVSLSSQSRASLAAHYGLSPLELTQKLSAFLKHLGVDYFFEDSLGRDLALMATLEEFWERYSKHKAGEKGGDAMLPLLTSECPGWVCYAEKTHGELVLPYMSNVRSAIATLGSLTKKLLPSKLEGVGTGDIYHCFISPCFDKKLEASREDLKTGEFADLDCVLATTEFYNLLTQKNFKAFISGSGNIEEEGGEAAITAPPLDGLLQDKGSSEETLFSVRGSSGGYLEYVFRECALRLKGQEYPQEKLPLKVIRNADFQEITLEGDDGEPLLHFALAYGFRNIQNVIRRMKQKKMTYHFVEVMACPSGCLNGGGQMKEEHLTGVRVLDRKKVISDLEQLYHHKQIVQRKPEANPNMNQIMSWLGGFKTKLAADVLSIKFKDHSKKSEEASMMMLDF